MAWSSNWRADSGGAAISDESFRDDDVRRRAWSSVPSGPETSETPLTWAKTFIPLGKPEQIPGPKRDPRQQLRAAAVGSERKNDDDLAVAEHRFRDDACRQHVEDRARLRGCAGKADIARRDPQPLPLAGGDRRRRHQQPAAIDAKRQQSIGGVIGFDRGVQADRRLAGSRRAAATGRFARHAAARRRRPCRVA